MVCFNCKSQIPDNVTSCPNCGAPVMYQTQVKKEVKLRRWQRWILYAVIAVVFIGMTAYAVKIYLDNANGYMVDLGVRYQAALPGLFVAASLQNFGYSTQMAQEKIRLPQTLRLGVAYRLPVKPVQMMVAFDYVKVVKEDAYLNVGTEVLVLPALALRLGYQTGFEEKGMSVGFGVNIGRAGIDYAYVPFGRDLGDSHRFSLTLVF